MCEVYDEVYENLPRYKEAGAYGIIVEGMKFAQKKPGLVKVAGDWTYPRKQILADIKRLKTRAHELGLAFFSGENRTRQYGDSLCCCGCADLEGFTPNTFNLNHLVHGDKVEPTERMKTAGTAMCFQSIYQDTVNSKRLKNESFANEMIRVYTSKGNYVKDVFALGGKEE